MNYASDRRGAEAVVAAITASGGRAIVLQGDVSKLDDVARLFVEAKATYGALDVLVNNAAVYKLNPLGKGPKKNSTESSIRTYSASF